MHLMTAPPHLLELGRKRQSEVLLVVMGDRPELSVPFTTETHDLIAHHLIQIGKVPKISMMLYIREGDLQAARSVVQLVRQFCDNFEVIVPSRAWGPGTLLALGADLVVLLPTATLGALDHGDSTLTPSQIRRLVCEMVAYQLPDGQPIDPLLDLVCAAALGSGFRNYTIHSKQAIELDLLVHEPDAELARLIGVVFEDVEKRLQLGGPFDSSAYLGDLSSRKYCFQQALIWSSVGKHSHELHGFYERDSDKCANHVLFRGWTYLPVLEYGIRPNVTHALAAPDWRYEVDGRASWFHGQTA